MSTSHIRSTSLPSRSHPLSQSVDEQLCKLKASKSTSVSHQLGNLKDLYDCLDDFIQLPLTQQSFSGELQGECVEELPNGSLRLLDLCGIARDAYSEIKERVLELESSLRTRRGKESGLASEVDAYIASRKRLNKVVSKSLIDLKRKEKRSTRTFSSSNSSVVDLVNMLKGVEEASIGVFEPILSSISLPKSSGWTVVSNILQSKRVSCEGKINASKAEEMEGELLVLKSRKDINSVQVQNVLKRLELMELSIQEMGEELECVYRRLVKARVSVLNIFNH